MIIIRKNQFNEGNADDVNFYFEGDRVAVSDNHKMAYWFFRHKATDGSTLVHIDTHLDCSLFRDCVIEPLQDGEPFFSAQQFADHRCQTGNGEIPAVHSGNWIPALHTVHPHLFKRVLLRCHNDAGSVLKELPFVKEIDEACVFSDDLLLQSHICLSIDIDYYFTKRDGLFMQRQTNQEPITHFRRILDAFVLLRHVPVFIALSPEYCGGWQNVIPFVRYMDKVLDQNHAHMIEESIG